MAAAVKAFGLTFEEVLYDLSYSNLILYNAVLPSYKSNDKKEGGAGEQEVINASDPKNKERVRQFFNEIE